MKPYCLPSLPSSGVLIATALPVELRPAIDHYRAKRIDLKTPWPIYISQDRSIILTETGIGSCLSAAALSYALAALGVSQNWCSVTMGLAGSGHYPRGQWLQGYQITERATKHSFYLSPPFVKAVPATHVVTVSSPNRSYEGDCVFEMEAFGFVKAATRFISLSQIGVLKLVSDTTPDELESLTKQSAKALLSDTFSTALPVIDSYLTLSNSIAESRNLPELPSDLWTKHHFTLTQRRAVERAWRSFRLFYPSLSLMDCVEDCSSAKECLEKLNRKLKELAFHWEEE